MHWWIAEKMEQHKMESIISLNLCSKLATGKFKNLFVQKQNIEVVNPAKVPLFSGL